MWMILYMLASLARAEPRPKAEGLFEVMQCVTVAEQLESTSSGYEWTHLQGEHLKSGTASCTITLKKLNHEVTVTGTIENGVFIVVDDGQSWVAIGDSDDYTLV